MARRQWWLPWGPRTASLLPPPAGTVLTSHSGREGPREEPSLPSSLPGRVPRGLSGEQTEDHVASVGKALDPRGCVEVSLSALFIISEARFLVKPLLPLQQTLSRHTFAGKPGYASSNPEFLCGFPGVLWISVPHIWLQNRKGEAEKPWVLCYRRCGTG